MIDITKLKNLCQTLRILYVEDDEALHKSVLRYLQKLFQDVDDAYDGEDGLNKYKSSEYDIVLTDIKMPKLDGLRMTEEIKKINPNQELVILSAHTEHGYFLDAIHLGISDYILKPIDYEQMNSVLYKVANRLHIIKENQKYHENLEKLLIKKTKLLTDNYEQTLTAMIKMIEQRGSYTGGHSERVAYYCKIIAQEMKLSEDECDLIYRAGMLHDIGKIVTPDTVLLKPGKLSDREYFLIKLHVTASYELLSKIPMYSTIAEIVMSHHERYDGSGYPKGLKGDNISLLSHIMIVADAFDAMTTNRIYKGRKTIEDAIEEIEELSGKQFSPTIVPYACKVLQKVTISNTSQLPKTMMEEERFSYFYRDSLTDTYNCEYLDIFLQQIVRTEEYNSAIFYMKNFSQYNNKHGWNAGNELLKKFSQNLRENYHDGMIFRIHGDDFIVITKEFISKEHINCIKPSFLLNTDVEMSCKIFHNFNDMLAGINILR